MKFMLENGAAGLLLDPGLGKTSITLGAFKVLKNEGISTCMLVIAPLRPCYEVWPAEVNKWTDFGGISVGVLHGPKKEKVLNERHDVYVINPDGLSWLLTSNNWRKLDLDVLVVDESTKFKNTSTMRFKLLKQFLPKFNRRYILTGTPIPNGLMDIFGQMYLLDLGNALGAYISHYRMKYFDPTGYEGHDWRLKPGAEKKIYAAIKPLVLRLAAADYLDLPPIVESYIYVDLPPKARKIYDDMEELMIAELEQGGVVAALSAGSAAKKCEQIANGGMYFQQEMNEDGTMPKKRTWEDIHTAKIDAVTDLLEEISGQGAIVTYDFKHDLARLQSALGRGTIPVPRIGAGITPKMLAETMNRWNTGQLEFLLGHFASMSHGLNMQTGGSHAILHSLTWNLEDYDQLIKRLVRQGSIHKRIFRHHIVARDTVDEAKMFAIRAKDKTQTGMLNALRGYVRKRVGND